MRTPNINLLEKRYFQPGETWETFVDRICRHAAGDDTGLHKLFYEHVVSGKFLPSRMTYMGTEHPFASSCFVFPIEDSLQSIMQTLKDACECQKFGGGTGYNFSHIRPKGDRIASSGGEASGPVSFMELYHHAMEVVKRAGRKHSAQMGILNCDHPDIFEFVDCKKKENALWTFNISIGITDDFMNAVTSNDKWDLVYGERVYKTIQARELWSKIAKGAWSNGDPGVVFLDTVNRNNCFPEKIESTNPCFAPDTLIQTKQGHFRIRDLVGQTVEVWDGEQWIAVNNFRITGRYQPTLSILLQSGDELSVTPYHKMILDDGVVVQAKDLKEGDKLLISNAPLSHGSINEPGAYLKGFLAGDGTYTSDKLRPELWLYPPKRICANRLKESLLEIEKGEVYTNAISNAGFNDVHYSGGRDLLVMQGMAPAKDELYPWVTEYKEKLPDRAFAWNLESKANFIAGIFDADGTAKDGKNGFGYQLSSIHKEFLIDLKALLMSVGIKSKLGIMKHAGKVNFNDGYGEYNTKTCWRLGLSQLDSVELAKLVKFERLKDFSQRSVSYNVKPRYNKVVSIVDGGVEEEVYCCTVNPANKVALTVGIVTRNCGEQALPPYTSCNLGSVDLSEFVLGEQICWDELADAVTCGIHFLNNSLDKAFFPVKKVKEKTLKYRNIGLGVMGLADMFIKLDIPYDSDQAVSVSRDIAKFIQGEAENVSRGIGDGKRLNTTLTSQAPTGSISMIFGTSSGIEPIFGIVTRKNTYVGQYDHVHPGFMEVCGEYLTDKDIEDISLSGTTQYTRSVPMEKRELFKTANEISYKFHIAHQSAWQKYTDNSVSKTINMPNDATVEDVFSAYRLAWESGCKSVTIYRDGSRSIQVVDNKKKDRNVCSQCGNVIVDDNGLCVNCGIPITSDKPIRYPRPTILTGSTYRKETPLGKAYVTINHNGSENPLEVFMTVGKAGSDVNGLSEAMGRLISLVLRAPMSIDPKQRLQWVAEELKGIGGNNQVGFGPNRVKSLPDGVAQVLLEYLGTNDNGSHLGELCPECGSSTLIEQEGCQKCIECGYSKC